ncbi:tetratricopeptide repeat protein 7B [Eurytemora carolleeae]|uniref:tetratricopeptide repeat protein 7B n=1 Tax=Eurytemora carolleeae TaxID=1294199 RepID=UPI000C765288|nr:tetratricopeptide repeat protein 7B [Eurytemora carolleeae]|eukprot:XP_023330111.1 tetratricopeptide repeat protein 7B-like [Eurytemora affinis]
MSTRGKRTGSLETDIERAREEGNWKKVIELANLLKDKDKQNEALGWFLIGEGKLEEHLEEFPPLLENSSTESSRDVRLKDAKACLERTVGEDAAKIGVHLDSWILLAKLHFAVGNFSESLKFYEKSKLETLEEKKLPPRSLKIIAEAFAIKGMCFEKIPIQTTSKSKLLDRENKITKCYELSGDLALLYLQEIDSVSRRGYAQSTLSMQSVGVVGNSSSPVPPYVEHKLGPILENAMLKAPQIYLKTGKIEKAIARFRAMLSAEETRSTTSVRLGLAKQLAETLIHSISDKKYSVPDTESPKRVNSRQSAGMGESPWKPKRFSNSNQFLPVNKQEEIVLLLLLCEAMVSKHVPLNQNPEYDAHRTNTMHGATSVFNLMNLAMARFGHFRTLCEMFERSLRFAPKEEHIWAQFALSLACDGRSLRCVVVLKEVAEMDPEDASPCLVAARICFERLNLLAEGIEWAERALIREEEYPQDLRSRCHLYIGIGHYLKSTDVETREARQNFAQSALHHLQISIDLDPGDHLAHFYLALHLASLRRIPEAFIHVNKAIQLNPVHLQSLHLATLVISAKGDFDEALKLCEQTLLEYPENLPLLALRARLEEQVYGGDVALRTARYMFNLLRDLGEISASSTDSGIGIEGETRSMVAANYSHWDTLSDKDSVSLQAQSVAASQVEKTLSEVASSLSAGVTKNSTHETAYNQIRTWLLTAELYLRQDQVEAAQQCCNEARQLYPLSYHILYLKGAIHQYRDEWESAKTCFEDSLSINPHHISSLQSLGLTHLKLGSPRLAELVLRAAIRLQPHDPVSWTYFVHLSFHPFHL